MIYVVKSDNAYLNEIVGVTTDKDCAENMAKAYGVVVVPFEDAKTFSATKMWVYSDYVSETLKLTLCHAVNPVHDGKEYVNVDILPRGSVVTSAYVFADDEEQARKKAQEMIAEYKS